MPLPCRVMLLGVFPAACCITLFSLQPPHRRPTPLTGGRGVVEGLSKQLGLNPTQMAPSANALYW